MQRNRACATDLLNDARDRAASLQCATGRGACLLHASLSVCLLAPASRSRYVKLQAAVAAVQGVLDEIQEHVSAAVQMIQEGLTDAAADSGEQTAAPLSAMEGAGTSADPAGTRDPIASLSVRELRLLLQLLGIDSSGCLEKEELVEKVEEAGRNEAQALLTRTLQARRASRQQQQLRQEGREQPGSSGGTGSAPPPPVADACGSTPQQRSPQADLAGFQASGRGGVEPAAALAAAPGSHNSGDSSSQSPERRCARCDASPSEAVKLRRCPCRLVRYCGERCQGEDWPRHKAACREARRRQRQEGGGPA
jgi:hypothetical protein